MNGFDTTIENVFTEDEMETLIEKYKNSSIPLGILNASNTQTILNNGVREASGLFIKSIDPIVERFKSLTAAITGLPVCNQELPNFVKYDKNGFYKPHFDGFDQETENGQKGMRGWGQRMFSSILYLNEDFTGGDTFFPDINKTIKPATGKVYIWRNASDDLKLDRNSLHGGNSIQSGVKYIIVIWTRSNSLA